MGAGVAFADAMQATGDQCLCKILVMPDGVQMASHFGRVMCHQEILPRPEQAFLVPPRRADQGNAASQRLEHPNRWDPRKGLDVRPARDMDGHPMLGEAGGSLGVRQPAPVSEAGGSQAIKRLRRVADTMYGPVKPSMTGGFDQEIMQFLRAFAIAPVADPDQVPLRPLGKQRAKNGCVGCLVPGKRPPAPAQTFIAAAQGFAERQHRIVVL